MAGPDGSRYGQHDGERNRKILNQIPVVDLADYRSTRVKDHDKFIETVATGLRDIGFIFVKSPDVTPILPPVYETYRTLFSLPPTVKESYARPDIFFQRGFTPPMKEIGIYCQTSGPGGTAQPDAKEIWFTGPNMPSSHPLVQQFKDLYAPNMWPREVPQFRPAVEALYKRLFGLGKGVLSALEEYLGYQKGFFQYVVDDSPTSMRSLHYPPVSREMLDRVVWGCEHTDINFITVLPASTQKGLWVQNRAGEWIPGMAPPGCSLVQVGDMLQYMTGGYFLSAHHKVDAPSEPTTVGRYSSALFVHARSDFTFQVDRRLTETPENFPEITAAQYLYQRLHEISLAKAAAREGKN